MNVCVNVSSVNVYVFHMCLCKDSLNYFLNGPSYERDEISRTRGAAKAKVRGRVFGCSLANKTQSQMPNLIRVE